MGLHMSAPEQCAPCTLVWEPNGVASQCQLWESWALAPSVEQAQEVGRGGDTGHSPRLATAGPVFTHSVLTFYKSLSFFSMRLLKAF